MILESRVITVPIEIALQFSYMVKTVGSKCRQLCTSDSRGNMSVLHQGGRGEEGGWGHCMHRYDSTCCVYTGSDIIPAHAHDPPLPPPLAQNAHISSTGISYFEVCSLHW